MNKNKGFIGLGLILVIIAVLVVGGGAYYLGTKNESVSKNAEENLPTENQNQKEIVGPSGLEILTGPFLDETNYVPPVSLISNIVWKIYQNQNFEIKYPSDWKIVSDVGFFGFDFPGLSYNLGARFEIADSTPDINYWIKDMENRKSPFTQKNIVIDGLPAKYVTYTNIEGMRSFYHVGNNEMGFRMFPSIGEKLKDPVEINKIEKIFEEMAYSFKFK